MPVVQNHHLNDAIKNFRHALETSPRCKTDFVETFRIVREFEKGVHTLANLLGYMIADHSLLRGEGYPSAIYLDRTEEHLQHFWYLIPAGEKTAPVINAWNAVHALILEGRQFIA